MTLYFFVKDGEILDGPRRLPSEYQNKAMGLSACRLDRAPATWLVAHGILPGEDEPPEYDPDTQRLVRSYDVQADHVKVLYTIENLPQAEIDDALNGKLHRLNEAVNKYIYAHYDQGTQATMQAIYVAPDRTTEQAAAIESVWAWIKAVLSDYYTRKATVAGGAALNKDFTGHDAQDPVVSLGSLMAG